MLSSSPEKKRKLNASNAGKMLVWFLSLGVLLVVCVHLLDLRSNVGSLLRSVELYLGVGSGRRGGCGASLALRSCEVGGGGGIGSGLLSSLLLLLRLLSLVSLLVSSHFYWCMG